MPGPILYECSLARLLGQNHRFELRAELRSLATAHMIFDRLALRLRAIHSIHEMVQGERFGLSVTRKPPCIEVAYFEPDIFQADGHSVDQARLAEYDGECARLHGIHHPFADLRDECLQGQTLSRIELHPDRQASDGAGRARSSIAAVSPDVVESLKEVRRVRDRQMDAVRLNGRKKVAAIRRLNCEKQRIAGFFGPTFDATVLCSLVRIGCRKNLRIRHVRRSFSSFCRSLHDVVLFVRHSIALPSGSSLVNKLSDDVFTKMTSKFSARRELQLFPAADWNCFGNPIKHTDQFGKADEFFGFVYPAGCSRRFRRARKPNRFPRALCPLRFQEYWETR